MTKYGKKIENRDLNLYIDSLKNKTYKLLPLREEKLQWEKHLETILIEISGFNSITLNQQVKIISVLSKLVIVPTTCGNLLPVSEFTNAPANPPPL